MSPRLCSGLVWAALSCAALAAHSHSQTGTKSCKFLSNFNYEIHLIKNRLIPKPAAKPDINVRKGNIMVAPAERTDTFVHRTLAAT